MFKCHTHSSCHGCCQAIDRRNFINNCGAAMIAAAGSLTSFAAYASEQDRSRIRVAAVFLMSMNTREIWPNSGFDTRKRQREVLARLRQGCPEIEFVPVTVEKASDMKKALALRRWD